MGIGSLILCCNSWTKRVLLLVFGGLTPFAAGCANYKWISEYDEALKLATEQKKPLFIYYRHWLSSDSTTMYNQVLSAPEVTAKFSNSINCQLEFDWKPNQEIMANYGVRTVPGFIIIKPDGTPPTKISGLTSKERFIRWVDSALRPVDTATGKPKAPPPSADAARVAP